MGFLPPSPHPLRPLEISLTQGLIRVQENLLQWKTDTRFVDLFSCLLTDSLLEIIAQEGQFAGSIFDILQMDISEWKQKQCKLN